MNKCFIDNFLIILLFVGLVSGQEVVGSAKPGEAEEQIEQLILDAYVAADGYGEILDEAFALTDKLTDLNTDFFRVYIDQSRLRIEASKISTRMKGGEAGDEILLEARLTAQGLAESVKMMDMVKGDLSDRLEDIMMYNRKQRGRVLSLMYRCEYSNGWVYYTISTIVPNGIKDHYLEEAERVFTSFLGKKYQSVNLPVMVNCLYGKGLCLRDSGRYYDLLVMLDTMAVDQSDAVKFARLRLAASVSLSLSVEILRVVQEYFGDDNERRLDGEELEMLVNCIEAGVKLLERDLPVKMKMSLRRQLEKAVDRTEGYGSYWQNRVSDMVKDIELNSPYVKLLQAYDVSESGEGKDYGKIYSLADEGLKLCEQEQPEKRSEFLYLKVVSSWNSHKLDEAWKSAVSFLEEFADSTHGEQVAGIACQVAMKLVAEGKESYDKISEIVEGLRAKDLVDKGEYLWTAGCLLINSGRYAEGYDFFGKTEAKEELPVRRYYGILLAILPMLKAGEIEDERATESILECCRAFTGSGSSFLQTSHFEEAAQVICEIADILLAREEYDLVEQVLDMIEDMPNVRGDVYAKYMGVKLAYRLAKGDKLNDYIEEISRNNLHNEPEVFNLLVSESRKNEMNGHSDNELLIKVYRLLLSSRLLDDKNAVAVRIYLSQAYFRSGRYDSFLKLAETIADNYPMHVTVSFYQQMAVSYRERGEYLKSAEYWNMLLQNSREMTEQWKEALYNKILCYNKCGESVKARQTLELAILRRPELLEDEKFKKLKAE